MRATGIVGHRQVTDAYLAQLARARGGRPATSGLPVAVAGVLVTFVLQLTTDTQVVNGELKPSLGPAWLVAAGALPLAGLVALTVGAAAAGR